MFKQAGFECHVVGVRVKVFRQTFTTSGIGSSAAAVQYDYSCSRDNTCEHSASAACRIRQLNLNG
ncbi:hypothetical protein ACT2FY_07960 [Paraburkholderia fungorum]|uniref:hypothetical protein n=1 Tax=Paraburkholderia fungorum TaxID=134537 RepID=UPI00402B946F